MTTILVLYALKDKILQSDPVVGGLASLALLGLAAVGKKIATSFYKTFLRPAKNLKKLGEWAVVTGATDGIGKAYALELAKKGLSVVIISRTKAKLDAAETEIKAFGVDCKVVVCDYSKFDSSAQATVRKAVEKLDIGVLVNNVGVSYRYPQFYHAITDDEAASLVEMNLNSTTWMTRMILPGMVERKRGTIVNISSGSALYTLPLLAGYSASKSYIEKFSRAIHAEYSAQGVSCQCQVPFYVATKLAKMRKSFMVPTPEQYVRLALRWVGQDDTVVSPYWPHAVQGYLLGCLPDSIVSTIIMNMHMAIRKKGMKKDAKLAAEGKKE